jgi:hypothetical protein
MPTSGVCSSISDINILEDKYIHYVLWQSASVYGVEQLLQLNLNDNPPKQVEQSWLNLTHQRIAWASCWVWHGSSQWLLTKTDDYNSRRALKNKADEILSRILLCITAHITAVLVEALEKLGVSRCVNRLQLCFVELSRYKYLLKETEIESPDDFLFIR